MFHNGLRRLSQNIDEDKPYWWLIASLSTALFLISLSPIVVQYCLSNQFVTSVKTISKEKQLKPVIEPKKSKIVYIKPASNADLPFLKKGVTRKEYLSR
tara:strand:+ start:692 stop:988 length:297 start_codon:yes stop_codon:yes gene_type:complete